MLLYCFCTVIYLTVVVSVVLCGEFQALKGLSAVDELEAILFPNRTAPSQLSRQLAISKVPWDINNPVPCAQCTGMSMCPILDNLRVEETYYPKDPGRKETCKVIDSFAKRISREVFGNGRAFRDTPQCRGIEEVCHFSHAIDSHVIHLDLTFHLEIVMQYLCLFYGSDNNMYRNYCFYQEDVRDPNSNQFLLAARPPCRSFCVQVLGDCYLSAVNTNLQTVALFLLYGRVYI